MPGQVRYAMRAYSIYFVGTVEKSVRFENNPRAPSINVGVDRCSDNFDVDVHQFLEFLVYGFEVGGFLFFGDQHQRTYIEWMQRFFTSLASVSLVSVLLGAAVSVPASAAPDVQDEIVTYLTPYDGGRGEDQTLSIIEAAGRKIRVCAYGFTDPAICDALIRASKRGCNVQIVMDSTQAAGPHQKPLVAQLVAAKIPVFIGKSAVSSQLIHAKFIIVDDIITESGSWNYSGNSACAQANTLDFIVSEKRARYFDLFWTMIRDHIVERQSSH
jgi:phosphatidylserine/phosphatidylglycerophosphate/cardiolipin synthase-like enzyme